MGILFFNFLTQETMIHYESLYVSECTIILRTKLLKTDLLVFSEITSSFVLVPHNHQGCLVEILYLIVDLSVCPWSIFSPLWMKLLCNFIMLYYPDELNFSSSYCKNRITLKILTHVFQFCNKTIEIMFLLSKSLVYSQHHFLHAALLIILPSR